MPLPSPDPLPFQAVELLFDRLTLVYGHHFTGRWSGMDLAVVKEDWRYQLAGLRPDQLDFAMENLVPGEPPDALMFRKLARAMPDDRRLVHHVLPPPSRPREVPREVRPVVAALLAPKPEDAEPPHIVMARDFIAKWDVEAAKPEHDRMRPTPTQQQWLVHWRNVLARYERSTPPAAAEPQQPPENP